MANGRLDRFQAGSLAKTVNVHTPDFSTDIELTSATVNMTSGINEGIGPRFGFSPLPGHMDQEAVAAGKLPGLMAAESDFGYTITTPRVGIFAIYPVILADPGPSINTRSTYYIMVVGYTSPTYAGFQMVDAVLLGTTAAGGLFGRVDAHSPLLYSGLTMGALASVATGALGINQEFVYPAQDLTTARDNVAKYLNAGTTMPAFVSSTQLSISGPDTKAAWLVGGATVNTAPTATIIRPIRLSFANFAVGQEVIVGGTPPEFNYGNFKNQPRSVAVYGLDQSGNDAAIWNISFTPTTSIYKPVYIDEQNQANIDVSGLTAHLVSGTPTSLIRAYLWNDESVLINSSYKAVLIAAGKPICLILQDWYRANTGTMTQCFDLVNNPLEPKIYPTYANEAGSSFWTVDGQTAQSSFTYFQTKSVNTAMTASTVSGLSLGGADTGILRAQTIYEFSYSVYNKRLNFETNVGTPVQFETGVNDFVSLILFDTGAGSFPAATSSMAGFYHTGKWSLLPYPGANTTSTGSDNAFSLNYLEYRFYYRELGQQEWLPALFIDAAKWWFYGPFTKLSACVGGIGGLPGGRPGGFNDYSRLPADNYSCTIFYKNRAFWISDKAIQFSLQNNIFAYPGRNSVACPTGSFKGAILHNYPGQAEQSSRLVVFGSTTVFVGRFTGNLLQVPVQISTDTLANFDLDGSDFVLDPWTSNTAFSYRAAVVAEGILYWWGPQGLFRDDGVQTPTRISLELEPDLFNFYNASKTDEIHAVYNDTSKEITWFYPPKVSDGFVTHALVYNRVRNTWLPQEYSGKIDAAQLVIDATAQPTAGQRAVVYSRESASSTIQRAYFYDQLNRASDIFPRQEMMVKQVATPVAGRRRLTLAAGFDATNFATIAAGDHIALQQVANYATSLATPNDFIGVVAATNAGAGTIDITLPSGVTFDAAAVLASNNLYFPIWHSTATGRGINGFSYEADGKFWIPGGMGYWANWLYLHVMFKLTQLLPAAAPLTVNLGHQTPISSGVVTEALTLVNNSAANCQIFHALTPGNQNFEGQGIKLTFSGIQLASAWVLQYLEMYTQQLDGLQVKLFEG